MSHGWKLVCVCLLLPFFKLHSQVVVTYASVPRCIESRDPFNVEINFRLKLIVRMLPRTLRIARTRLWFPVRCLTTQPEQSSKNWLTQKIESSPATKKWFLAIAKGLGYGSPKQLAGRRSFVLYDRVVALTPDQSVTFWQKGAEVRLVLNLWSY